jgi:hypothetical protein
MRETEPIRHWLPPRQSGQSRRRFGARATLKVAAVASPAMYMLIPLFVVILAGGVVGLALLLPPGR